MAPEAANLAHDDAPQWHPRHTASPALTNPDMILPDYEDVDSSMSDVVCTSDLDGQADLPLIMGKNAVQAATSVRDLQLFFAGVPSCQPLLDMERSNATNATNASNASNIAEAHHATPSTTIIYGNGTMLSDIGEVTEVESTVGKTSSSTAEEKPGGAGLLAHANGRLRSGGTLTSTPTSRSEATSTKTPMQKPSARRDRRPSLESISTITTRDHVELLADFDDAVSVDDSVFQGDDEGSLASSAWEESSTQDSSRLALPYCDSTERLSIHSTTSISRKADQILANAKKRLTSMEGNLSRARTTLPVTSSSSRSSLESENSTPSPPRQRAFSSCYRSNSAMSSIPMAELGRNSGEDVLKSGLMTNGVSERSQSAMGAAGGCRPTLTGSRSVDQIRSTNDTNHLRASAQAIARRYGGFLEPLSEDELSSTTSSKLFRDGPRLGLTQSLTFGSLHFEDDQSIGNNKVLRRPASTNQMRDLRGQVMGLKGKISSLRDQARADSIRRRSLQSLRDPSPFTHAQVDQWYAVPSPKSVSAIKSGSHDAVEEECSPTGGPNTNMDATNVSSDIEEPMHNEWDTTNPTMDHEVYVANRTSLKHGSPDWEEEEYVEPDDDDAEDAALHGFQDVEDLGYAALEGFQDVEDLGYESESGGSLYHDSVQHSISHEDREDAFDYERFFLHSALGTISQQGVRRRGSDASDTSEESVETARGLALGEADEDYDTAQETREGNQGRTRADSDSSTSTVATFATADEGRASRVSKTGAKDEASRIKFEETIRESATQARADAVTKESTKHVSYKIDEGARTSAANGVRDGVWAEGGRIHHPTPPSIAPGEGEDEGAELVANNVCAESRTSSTYGPSSQNQPSPRSTTTTGSTRRPSLSSFESTGTTRSFPLVNKSKKRNGIGPAKPRSCSDEDVGIFSDRLLQEAANVCEQQQEVPSGHPNTNGLADKDDESTGSSLSLTGSLQTVRKLVENPNTPADMQAMLREDQNQVERLVVCLGHCVLGLAESGRTSAEGRMFRSRINLARRILEGLEVE